MWVVLNLMAWLLDQFIKLRNASDYMCPLKSPLRAPLEVPLEVPLDVRLEVLMVPQGDHPQVPNQFPLQFLLSLKSFSFVASTSSKQLRIQRGRPTIGFH